MNDQSQHWRGTDGDAYHARNAGRVEANKQMFIEIWNSIPEYPASVIEFGAGTGENLQAIHEICNPTELYAIEINQQAAARIPVGLVMCADVLELKHIPIADMVLTKGFAVHVAPDDLPSLYDRIYHAARRYILLCEYHSPRLEPVTYRGLENRLWKGPYAEQMMDEYLDLKLVKTFFFSSVAEYPQDDLTCFLMERTG